MHPGAGSVAILRRAWALAFVALLAVTMLPPGAAQDATGPFVVETRYVVPAADLSTATVFVVYQQDDDDVGPLEGQTIGLRAPRGPGALSVRNDTGAALEWLPRADGGIHVGVPSGSREVRMVRHDVPLAAPEWAVVFAGPAHTVRTSLVVALPEGVDTPAASLPAGPGTLGALPAEWPQPAGHRYVAAGWAADEAPASVAFTGVAPVVEAGPPLALVLGLAVLLVVATLWALRLVHQSISGPTAREKMPILEHLAELRKRLLWVVGTLVGGSVFFFTFGFRLFEVWRLQVPVPVPTIYDNAAAQVFAWLSAQGVAPGVTIVVTNPFDAVVTQLGLAIGLAVLVTFPVLFYHVYAFLAPGLRPVERRAVLVSVPFVVVLFLLGGAFGLLFMMPFTIRVLYGFAGILGATMFLNVHDFVAFAAVMAVVFGLAFQLPLVMALTVRIGLVRAATYRNKWRHAVLIIVIVSAIVTDPTIITQLVVATVLSLLYVVGLALAYLVERREDAATDDAVPA